MQPRKAAPGGAVGRAPAICGRMSSLSPSCMLAFDNVDRKVTETSGTIPGCSSASKGAKFQIKDQASRGDLHFEGQSEQAAGSYECLDTSMGLARLT